MDINNIKKQINKLEQELELAKAQQRRYSVDINKLIYKIKMFMFMLNPPEILVSDHAMIRYLERVELLDTNRIKTKLIKKYEKLIIDNNGTINIHENDMTIVVEDFKFITIKLK